MLGTEIKQQFPETIVKENENLSYYTYTKTGGPADVLVFPKTKGEIAAIVAWVNEKQVPLTVLGNSSNVIIKDGGIRGIVMILTEMDHMEVKRQRLIVQSGARLIDASRMALAERLSGLEFACGIPGSVGGAVYMNAGAYDGEVEEVIESAVVITREGKIKTYEKNELEFSYRHSKLQETNEIVLEVVFHLEKGKQEAIKMRMDELTALRESKQPLEYPSCGSVFKRPPGYFTGKLIQEAGLQGLIWGGAQVSMKHAGFIVNINKATATDYIELIAHIKTVIMERYGVPLETEVRIIGEDTVGSV
ncbi:UDP-N-acetylmuramate dehydrogenase [Trichococcus collinsii]|uniref:UDP-N-acetylenolpyruvoylglucosamine reductase n=1 Tax=Trichococcus collinsii TaxID=157076 RepID=A0AB37ZYC2_9LACT|nr:UDP-N-acetylmuramate dehydrogenase [Trichococcus collinsii]CZR09026.1 udp-n-acetylenolpyruvoylglucosamine reductase [Trichococcus collinsii]SEA17899.1 UDP-N-acetylmuramate dehydrogenase [Trichococcus collinsii]